MKVQEIPEDLAKKAAEQMKKSPLSVDAIAEIAKAVN